MTVFIILAIAITVVYMIYYPVMIYLDLTKRVGTKKSSVEEIGVDGAAEDNNDTFVVRESEDGSFETVQLSSSAEGEERDLENSSELPESETPWINGGEDVPSETNVEDVAETGENFYDSSDDDVYSGTEETSTEENNPDEQEDENNDEVPVEETPDEYSPEGVSDEEGVVIPPSDAEDEENEVPGADYPQSHTVQDFVEELLEELEPACYIHFGEMSAEALEKEITSEDTEIETQVIYENL